MSNSIIDPKALAAAIELDERTGPYNTTGYMPTIRPPDGAENVLVIKGLPTGIPRRNHP